VPLALNGKSKASFEWKQALSLSFAISQRDCSSCLLSKGLHTTKQRPMVSKLTPGVLLSISAQFSELLGRDLLPSNILKY
jgi:hypothetical protein